ncbi:MAG: LysR substrate-binding domain-containing protein [Hyphomicrobiales bacterium]
MPYAPEAAKEAFRLEELAEMPMTLYDHPILRDYFMNFFRQRNLQPKIQFRTKSYQTLCELVSAGLGYSLLNLRPQSSVSYHGNRLVQRNLENNVFVPSIILAYPNRESRSHGVEAFGNICKQYFP